MKSIRLLGSALVLCVATPALAGGGASCSDDDGLMTWDAATLTCTVAPSGNPTGITDAANIEKALNYVKQFGGLGVVQLLGSPGDPAVYSTSTNVVSASFTGGLHGGGAGATIWHAGRKNSQHGFAGRYSPHWTDGYSGTLPTTVLQLDDAVGEVDISGITFVVDEDDPAEPFPVYWCAGNPDEDGDGWPDDCGVDTRIWTVIELIGHGPAHHTHFSDLEVLGTRGLWYGIHDMPLDLSGPDVMTESSATFEDIYLEGLSGCGIIAMAMEGDGGFRVSDSVMRDVWCGFQSYFFTAPVVLVDNDIETYGGYALESWEVDADATFAGNTVSSRLDFWGPSSGWDIHGNTFGQDAGSIRFLWAAGNTVGENTWPDGASLCDEIWDYASDNPLDNNDIEGWEDECLP